MEINRRDFFKLAGITVAALVFGVAPAEASGSRGEVDRGAEIHKLLTNSEFFLQMRGSRRLFTAQLDETQYDTPAFKNNACGQALTATILKVYEFLRSGVVPDITIQTIRAQFESATYLGAGAQQRIIEWDQAMKLSSVKEVLDFYAAEYSLQTVAFNDIPIIGYTKDHYVNSAILTKEKRDTLINQVQSQKIFESGGMLVMFSTTYGGHFFLVTDLYEDEDNNLRAFVIDSLGPTKPREGLVGDVSLASFVGEWDGQLGLISAFGVKPTY